jgi:hypothetical protein
VYAQATPPQDTRDGIIWVDTSLASKPTKVYSADTESFVGVGITDYNQLENQRVYAQATPPQDTRDGIIWVDTSLADKPTKVYSADTQSFAAVGFTDYNQLENRITGSQVDQYVDGTLGQVESRGFQTPTNYASSVNEVMVETVGDSGTLTDGLENYVGYFIDSYEYEIYFSVGGSNNVKTNLSFTPSGGLTRVNGLNIPTDPEDTINHSESGSKTASLSDSANFDPIQVTESDPFSFSYDASSTNAYGTNYTVEYTATFNVVTNMPHNHEFNYAN